MSSRVIRDALCSLHLFCGAVAGIELAEEHERDVSVFLHGGCFSIDSDCIGMKARDIIPDISTKDETCESPRDGEVSLKRKTQSVLATAVDSVSETAEIATVGPSETLVWRETEGREHENASLQVPRNRVLLMSRNSGLRISDMTITHGESETRFIAAFKNFVAPTLTESSLQLGGSSAQNGCVVVSKDTDVTVIIILAECMRNMKVIHVLGESVINIDELVAELERNGMSRVMFACAYVMAGCDFSAGTFGVSHVHYLRACARQIEFLRNGDVESGTDSLQLLVLFAYLEKYGFRKFVDYRQSHILHEQWRT